MNNAQSVAVIIGSLFIIVLSCTTGIILVQSGTELLIRSGQAIFLIGLHLSFASLDNKKQYPKLWLTLAAIVSFVFLFPSIQWGMSLATFSSLLGCFFYHGFSFGHGNKGVSAMDRFSWSLGAFLSCVFVVALSLPMRLAFPLFWVEWSCLVPLVICAMPFVMPFLGKEGHRAVYTNYASAIQQHMHLIIACLIPIWWMRAISIIGLTGISIYVSRETSEALLNNKKEIKKPPPSKEALDPPKQSIKDGVLRRPHISHDL